MRIAVDCGYLEPADAAELLQRLDGIGRRLNVMMRKAEEFRTFR